MPQISICSAVGVNTGAILCDPKKGVPKKLVVGPATFTSVDWDTEGEFLTKLLAKINQEQGASDKMYPFPLIEGNADNTEAPVFGNLGYGARLKLRDGLPSYSFQVRCGESLFKRLRAFDGLEIPVGVIDANNRYWGTINNAGVFSGYTALISVTGNGFEDATAVEKKTATIDISLVSTAEFYDSSAWIDGIIESDIKGLNNFQLAVVGDVDLTTVFQALIPQAELAGLNTVVNLANFYGTQLGVTAKWHALIGEDLDTPLAITGATYNPGDKSWSIVFNTVAFNALDPGDIIRVYTDDPATLYAAGITGVEVLYVDIEVPGS